MELQLCKGYINHASLYVIVLFPDLHAPAQLGRGGSAWGRGGSAWDVDRGSACRRGGSAWGREDLHGDVEDLHGDVEDLHEDEGKKEQATFT